MDLILKYKEIIGLFADVITIILFTIAIIGALVAFLKKNNPIKWMVDKIQKDLKMEIEELRKQNKEMQEVLSSINNGLQKDNSEPGLIKIKAMQDGKEIELTATT